MNILKFSLSCLGVISLATPLAYAQDTSQDKTQEPAKDLMKTGSQDAENARQVDAGSPTDIQGKRVVGGGSSTQWTPWVTITDPCSQVLVDGQAPMGCGGGNPPQGPGGGGSTGGSTGGGGGGGSVPGGSTGGGNSSPPVRNVVKVPAGDKKKAINAEKMFRCFNIDAADSTFSMTYYVDQPIAGSPNYDRGTGLGRTFIEVTQQTPKGTTRIVFGVSSKTKISAGGLSPRKGTAFYEDASGGDYDVSITYSLTKNEMSWLMRDIEDDMDPTENPNPTYHINDNNDVDWAIRFLPWGVNSPLRSQVPSASTHYGNDGLRMGDSSSATFGQGIRAMNSTTLTSPVMSINTTSGAAPSTSNCSETSINNPRF